MTEKDIQYIDITDFEIIEKINHGITGEVYKVRQKSTNNVFAAKVFFADIDINIKIISPELLNLIRETNNMSKLNHPSIVKLIGFSPINFLGQPKPVLLLEYVENKTLAEILDLERRSLSPKHWDDTKKLSCLYAIASSMKYLHLYNVLHRDLKASNILMDCNFCPKIGDFGLSKIYHSNQMSLTLQSARDLKGTPLYMAPEIFQNEKYSTKSDVYAFAIIIYEVMSLEIPFKNYNIHKIAIDVINGIRPDLKFIINEAYKDLIERCWSNDPDERPSFDEIVFELANNPNFITESVDEEEFHAFVRYIGDYQATFEAENRIIDINLYINRPEKAQRKSKSLFSFLNMFNFEYKPKKIFPDESYGLLDENAQKLVKQAFTDPEKQFIIGKNLIEGINSFPQNTPVGVMYLEESISLDYIDSAIYFANILLQGTLIPKNLDKAKSILSKFLKNNDGRVFYLYGKAMKMQNKYSDALKYFEKGKNVKNVDSMYEYAKLLFTGFGGKQDAISSVDNFKIAEANGSIRSANFLRVYDTLSHLEGFTNLPLESQQFFISQVIKFENRPETADDDNKFKIIIKPKNLKILNSINSSNLKDFISFLGKSNMVQFNIIYRMQNYDKILRRVQNIKDKMQSIKVHLIISGIKKLNCLEKNSNIFNSITIEDSVIKISNGAFSSLENLEKITFTPSITEISESLLCGCTSIKEIEILNSVKAIKNQAFENCTSLTQVVIPASVKYIGSSAFKNCISLTQIIIPTSITFIGDSAFENCASLNQITLPNSFTQINKFTFKKCTNLGQIVIPLSIEKIEDKSFEKCNNLTRIEIPSSVNHLGDYIFNKCTRLTKITINSPHSSIRPKTFDGCSSLNKIIGSQSVLEKFRQIAYEEYFNNNIDKAIRYFKIAANSNELESIHKYACMMMFGDNIPINKKKAAQYFKKAADLGHVPSMISYAIIRETGDRINKNKSESMQYYKNAADRGNVEAMVNYSYLLYHDDVAANKTEAYNYFKMAFEIGGTKIMHKYSIIHIKNDKTAANICDSYRYFKMAVELDFTDVLNHHGYLLENGEEVAVNKTEACKYYKMAADKGNDEALCNYAKMLEKGEGIRKDLKMASRYYKMTANRGNDRGMYNYSRMLQYGYGVVMNKKEAIRYYKMAIDKGNSYAMNNYGLMLENGEGVKINNEEACRYYKMSADAENDVAMCNYGYMLENGKGVWQNYSEACKYYKMAAEKGNCRGMHMYGRMLQYGYGVAMNKKEAIRYYKMAIDKGNSYAMNNYGLMLENGEGVKINNEEACRYYKMSADAGYDEAMCNYGYMLENGKGVWQNYSEACKYYKMAAEKGNCRGMYMYGIMLEFGYGIDKNKKEANRYFRMADEMSNSNTVSANKTSTKRYFATNIWAESNRPI